MTPPAGLLSPLTKAIKLLLVIPSPLSFMLDLACFEAHVVNAFYQCSIMVVSQWGVKSVKKHNFIAHLHLLIVKMFIYFI